MEVIAEGLAFPEGPIVLPDGSVILVEIKAGALTRVWGDGKREVIAALGGGPNGAAIGPDGAMAAGIAWSDGRPGWSLNGTAYFAGPETFQIQLAPKTGADATRTLTFTFHRGQ